MPTISFVDSITVLQRQDWLRGNLLYKREKKTQNKGGEIEPKNRTKKRVNNQSKSQSINQKKKIT